MLSTVQQVQKLLKFEQRITVRINSLTSYKNHQHTQAHIKHTHKDDIFPAWMFV